MRVVSDTFWDHPHYTKYAPFRDDIRQGKVTIEEAK